MINCPKCTAKTYYIVDSLHVLWHKCCCGYSSCLAFLQSNGVGVSVKKDPKINAVIPMSSTPYIVLKKLVGAKPVHLYSLTKQIRSDGFDLEYKTTALSLAYLCSFDFVSFVSVISGGREKEYWRITKKGSDFLSGGVKNAA